MVNNNFSNGQGAMSMPRVLIVDDNAMILRNIKSMLDDEYMVSVAASGKQAFNSIASNKPDIILLDYEMPEMNGKEVMEKLLEDENLKDIPVIFLTGTDSKQRVIDLLALKPAGYMLKPADPVILLDKIKHVLGK